MKRFSISVRLTAWYASIFAVGLTIFGVVMWFVLATSMLSWKDRTLGTRAIRTEAALTAPVASDAPALNRKLDDVVGLLPEGEWIQIVSAGGEQLFPAGRRSSLLLPPQPCSVPVYRDRTLNREHFREFCRPVTYAGKPAYLLVPSPLSEDRILLRAFSSGLYRIIPILLVVSSVGGYLLSRRALAPVDVVIAEAQTISAQDLSRRLTVSTADDQLRRLALEWNSLLSRIEGAMTRISQFTADASHELRSPIAFIRATAEFQLGNPDLPADMRDALVAIRDETRMTTELLESLLLLARAETDDLQPAEPTDLRKLLTDITAHFAPALDRQQQEFIMTLSPDGPIRLKVDAGHLRCVLTAILDNAMKYTPAHGRISIGCACEQALHVRITDTGIGIAEEHLHRVFDRFFRADSARTTMHEGVGLGLAIAKQMMEKYGGSIQLESRVAFGTCVTLTFPKALTLPG